MPTWAAGITAAAQGQPASNAAFEQVACRGAPFDNQDVYHTASSSLVSMRTTAIHLILLPGLAAFVGCQNSTPPPTATSASSQPAAAAAPGGSPAAAPVDPAHPEMKWIGNIPYDVFYDQPLTVAADSTVVASVAASPAAGAPTNPASAPAPPAPTSTTPAPAATAASAVDWNTLAPMSAIVDEVKQIRVRLEKNLLKVGDFNKNTAQIAQDGALLAAIGVVVEKHPGELNWKDKAKFVRDLGYQITVKAEGTGMKPFNATKAPFEDVKKLLDGEAPTGTAKADVSLADVADRAALMAKLNATYESVKSNVNTAGRLKELKDKVAKDLAIMNLMMTVMGDHSYDQADDPRYAGYVQAMLNEQKAATEAANSDNFDAFSAAIGKINNTCNECHMIFRTGSN